ncbi:MAG: hypothetical protein H6626_10530 [Pseudobdellovibrionaceae bacterium]|nr:hypothetical protein [Bdellovibrionales bacterium]USN46644.1 MAG: hypothetical protein H6626_10530 [Pseudobdellovibrionaceae bacterium]
MAQCPLCSSEIHADFGLVDCLGCGAVLAVDMDGTVRAEEASGSETPAPIQDVATSDENYESPPAVIVSEDYANPEPPVEMAVEYQENDGNSSYLLDESDVLQEPEPAFEPADYGSEFEEPTQEGNLAASLPPPIDSADLSDISSFANSEVSQGREGLLRFHLKIAGVDTRDVREELFEALDDQRFLWDAQAMMADMKNGQMLISGISAVKAYILIQRLRHLPIEITWEQYAIHQS